MPTTNKAGEILCECCNLVVTSCGKQAENKQRNEHRQREKKLRQRGWFGAQWPGTCDKCEERFRVNDLIQSAGRRDGRNAYVAACCAPEV